MPDCGPHADGWGRSRSRACRQPVLHVVYTLPSKLRDIAYQNKRLVYDPLMKAAAETTLAIAADPKRLGARIGITAVLHTWGSALTHHPHVHMIVPGGGLSLDGTRWISSRSNFLVHVNVLARLFRGKMLAMLWMRTTPASRSTPTPDSLTRERSSGSLPRCGASSGWSTARRRLQGPSRVLRYLSRYIPHRVAISNRRLVAADDTGIAFRWKDYRRQRPWPLEDDAASSARVHPALPAAPAAWAVSTASATTGSFCQHPTAPRTSRRPAHYSTSPACRRPATAARWHAGCATCCLARARAVALA